MTTEKSRRVRGPKGTKHSSEITPRITGNPFPPESANFFLFNLILNDPACTLETFLEGVPSDNEALRSRASRFLKQCVRRKYLKVQGLEDPTPVHTITDAAPQERCISYV